MKWHQLVKITSLGCKRGSKNLNEEIILKMVKPYVRNKSITYFEFDNIFNFLSRKEQYEVANILDRNDISLRAEDTDEDNDYDEIFNEGNPIGSDNTVTAEDFEVLYDDVFLDDYGSEVKSDYSPVYKEVKQSNDILCRLLQEGNEQAKRDLCIKNKRLVDKCVNIYGKAFGNNLPFDDLEQAGMIGLLKAANKFDYSKGYQFSTYATWWIRQSISREIMETGFVVRIPVHMMEAVAKVTTLDNKNAALGMDFQERIDAIQSETNFSSDKVMYCLMLRNNFLSNSSLNTPVGEEEDIEIQDMLYDEECPTVEEMIELSDLQKRLSDILDTLTERESNIVILRFGLLDGRAMTLEEIGHRYNVTRERIRQIEAKALRKLRHPSRSKKIKDYFL